MEKSQKRLILFMPSMEGGGVEKNIIIVANYLSKFIKKNSNASLKPKEKIIARENSIKNFIRLLWKNLKRD